MIRDRVPVPLAIPWTSDQMFFGYGIHHFGIIGFKRAKRENYGEDNNLLRMTKQKVRVCDLVTAITSDVWIYL